MRSGIDSGLPNELRLRANEAYNATGIDLSLLHHVAYSLEANATEIAELRTRPTPEAYDAACKALHHWREEAMRLAKLAGVEPRQMNKL